jgi:hypothetical protein
MTNVFPVTKKLLKARNSTGKYYFLTNLFSQFCGHKACEKCAHKKRAFANSKYSFKQMKEMSITKIQKECTMGTVCRICDRKFFLRLTYQDFANELM